jgi:hypothetical protein
VRRDESAAGGVAAHHLQGGAHRVHDVQLRTRVNDDLTLDAGTIKQPRDDEIVIRPPRMPLFHQLLDYLRSKPDPRTAPRALSAEDEGVAAATVVLRWGSYFGVLADAAKPIWAQVRSPERSRIADSEMARINIEASAALAEWVDIARAQPATYEELVRRALAYLPMPKLRPKPTGFEFAALAMPEVAGQLLEASGARRLRIAADVQSHPSRVYANALVNVAWRNGPVEEIHAGAGRSYSLDRRRVTVAEERTLMSFAADRLSTGMDVSRKLAMERARSWAEQVLPYALAEQLWITPSGWTLTEATREVRLTAE